MHGVFDRACAAVMSTVDMPPCFNFVGCRPNDPKACNSPKTSSPTLFAAAALRSKSHTLALAQNAGVGEWDADEIGFLCAPTSRLGKCSWRKCCASEPDRSPSRAAPQVRLLSGTTVNVSVLIAPSSELCVWFPESPMPLNYGRFMKPLIFQGIFLN